MSHGLAASDKTQRRGLSLILSIIPTANIFPNRTSIVPLIVYMNVKIKPSSLLINIRAKLTSFVSDSSAIKGYDCSCFVRFLYGNMIVTNIDITTAMDMIVVLTSGKFPYNKNANGKARTQVKINPRR